MVSTQSPGIPELVREILQLRRLSRGSTIVGLAMLVLIWLISLWSLSQTDVAGSWVSHTHQVISASNQLISDVKDAESGARAFLLQPIQRYRAEFDSALGRVSDDLTKLKSLTSDNAAQEARLAELTPILSRRMQRLAGIISVRASSGLSDSERLREGEETRQDAETILSLGQQIQGEEYRLLQERQQTRHLRLIEAVIGTLGSLTLALVALLVSSWQANRAIRDLIESDRRRHEQESMATSLFQAAPESILVVDQNGIIRRANPETERLFGYGPNEIRNQNVEIFIPNHLRGDKDGFRERCRTGSENQKFETCLLARDGREFFADVSLGYIRSNDDAMAVAFISDVTKRRADECAIRDYAAEMQQLAGKLITAQEDERRRIARDLHDDLNQKLAYISMDLARVARKEQGDGIQHELESLHQRAAQAADFVRNLSHQLHPAVLEDLGLELAIEEFCQEFQERSGITVDFESNHFPKNVRTEISSCLFYVVAESLRNIAKHARATRASVRIGVEFGNIEVDIEDDGIGLDRNSERTRSGIGVIAMRERLHLLKGRFEIHPAEFAGTRVSVALPL